MKHEPIGKGSSFSSYSSSTSSSSSSSSLLSEHGCQSDGLATEEEEEAGEEEEEVVGKGTGSGSIKICIFRFFLPLLHLSLQDVL
jgi:hypothetical protein